jgi:hypothetical protein
MASRNVLKASQRERKQPGNSGLGPDPANTASWRTRGWKDRRAVFKTRYQRLQSGANSALKAAPGSDGKREGARGLAWRPARQRRLRWTVPRYDLPDPLPTCDEGNETVGAQIAKWNQSRDQSTYPKYFGQTIRRQQRFDDSTINLLNADRDQSE